MVRKIGRTRGRKRTGWKSKKGKDDKVTKVKREKRTK